MIRKFGFYVLLIIVCIIFYGWIGYEGYKQSKICDELVILNDGTKMEATETTSKNGMTTIKLCDDQWVDIPTINIKMIKLIEK
jgi:hypothetical protein